MKHVQACLSARKDVESSFHHFEGPVKLVQACLCAANTLQCRLIRRGGAVKQACSSASKDGESSFHYCGGPLKLVQAGLCAGNIYNAVLTTEVVQLSSCSPS